MRGPSPLSVGQREFIAAFVSRLNGCQYCTLSHTTQTAMAGMPEAAVEAAERDIASAPVEAAFKPILAFVRALTLDPGGMRREMADGVYAAGWSEEALEDAIFVTCAFNFYNRWLDGHGIHGSREKVNRMAPIPHKQGYLAYNQKLVDEMSNSDDER